MLRQVIPSIFLGRILRLTFADKFICYFESCRTQRRGLKLPAPKILGGSILEKRMPTLHIQFYNFAELIDYNKQFHNTLYSRLPCKRGIVHRGMADHVNTGCGIGIDRRGTRHHAHRVKEDEITRHIFVWLYTYLHEKNKLMKQ